MLIRLVTKLMGFRSDDGVCFIIICNPEDIYQSSTPHVLYNQ